MSVNAKVTPPHARHARRAVVRDGAVRPLPRSESDGEHVPTETADNFTVLIRGKGAGFGIALTAVALCVGAGALGLLHRKLLLGRGDGHHIRLPSLSHACQSRRLGESD